MKSLFTAVAALAVSGGILTAADYSIEKCDSSKGWKLARSLRGKTDAKTSYRFASAEKAMFFRGPGVVVTRLFKEMPAAAGTRLDKKFTGIAFKVKGGGVDEWSTITIYAGPLKSGSYYFPVKDTQWREYRVPFSAMAPGSSHTMPFSEALSGEITEVHVGDRWGSGPGGVPRPDFNYMIKDIRLVDDVFPAPKKFAPAKLENAIAKMKAGKPVLILCAGDSITAGTGLKNRPAERYGFLLQDILRKHFNNSKIRVRVCAIGGAHTFNSLIWQERDLGGETPDVATMLIGYNNRTSCQTTEVYKNQLKLWIDRLCAATAGKTAVVLIPSVPGVPRFYSQQDMADATRQLAAEMGIAVADVEKWIMSVGPVAYKEKYLADSVHPNAEGHKKFAEIVAKVFTGK